MHFSAKKFFLFGFLLLLLVGIPITIYMVQQQQTIKQRAAPATNLSFNPDSSTSNPIVKNVGDNLSIDVMVDPGTNLVSTLTMEIQYDPDKLATASSNAFQINSSLFPSVTEGPTFLPGKITVAMSTGLDLTKAIQIKSKVATINFKALAATAADTPTLVRYGVNTIVTSGGPESQPLENVLASSNPATIVINSGPGITPTEPPPPPADTTTPAPTTAGGTPVPTATPGSTGTAPTCSSLAADTTSGTAPLTVSFTVAGTDSTGTISKATFNFGDGQVSDVTSGGGIGTNTVSAQLSHTYSAAGTFQATAILTNNTDNISSTTNCAQTITVGGNGTVSTATPTLAATGSTSAAVGFGAAAVIMIIGGGLLFLLL